MTCSDCGKEAECRPYGPGGSHVCFPCGMKDEAEMKRQFGLLLEANQAVGDGIATIGAGFEDGPLPGVRLQP